MDKKYKQIDINQIPSGKFEGYYWFSDQPEPELIFDKEIDKNKFTKLPFVIEANFYSKETSQSIQIKNIDNQYHCALIDLSDSEDDAQKYIGHKLEFQGKHYNFFMVEAWEEKNDEELLENMTVKVPSWTAFKGFIETKKTNKND